MKICATIPCLLLMLILTGCNRANLNQPATKASGTFDESLVSSNTTRHYRLFVPSSYGENTAVPLVINFHGLDSNSTQEEMLSGMSIKAEEEGFIVVYPDGLNKKWNDFPGAKDVVDRQFVLDLITFLESKYSIDPKRIYATGMSNGGGMANRVGCDLADKIAAIAPVSGAYNFWRVCKPARPMPVIAFHGTADHIVPYNGTNDIAMEPPIRDWAAAWADRNQCDANPVLTFQQPDVKGETWENCQSNALVTLYTIEKHGHSWPGSELLPEITSQAINATDMMWTFFVAHPMQ